MEKVLSVIVPTYNMEKYLDRCLTSLVMDDADAMAKLEVLVINDGSKDKSSAIAHSYESRYPYTFRVIDKENGNYGSCINRGLKEATGKYIKVLDADDYFETKNLCLFVHRLGSCDADVILTEFSKFDIDENVEKMPLNINCSDGFIFYLDDSNICKFLPKDWFMHRISTRVDILRNMAYSQTEGISYTDTEWMFYPFYVAKTIQYFDFNIYNYFVGRVGQTTDPALMAKSFDSLVIIAKKMAESYRDCDRSKLSIGQDAILKKQLYRLYKMIAFDALSDLPPNALRLAKFNDVDSIVREIPAMFDMTDKVSLGRYRIVHYFRKTGKDIRTCFMWKLFKCSILINKL